MTDDAKVAVMNVTLNALGADPVVDLSTSSIQKSGGLQKALRSADISRRAVLTRHGWQRALNYTTLPVGGSAAGNLEFPYQYQLPGDALRAWRVGSTILWPTDFGWMRHWRLGSIENDLGTRQVIYGNSGEDPLQVSYIRDAGWDALSTSMIDAVGLDLAARICLNYGGASIDQAKLEKRAETKIALAIGEDGTQEGGEEPLSYDIPASIRNFSR